MLLKWLVITLTVWQMGGDGLEYEHRLEPSSFERMARLHPHVKEASGRYDVPPYILFGTIYNESNGHPEVTGDGGRAWGLGQTHCFWIHEIPTPAAKCPDLLNPGEATMATAAVLRHIRDHYGGGLTWKTTIKYYHLGPEAPFYEDTDYINRTLYFGELFSAHYRAHQQAERLLACN